MSFVVDIFIRYTQLYFTTDVVGATYEAVLVGAA